MSYPPEEFVLSVPIILENSACCMPLLESHIHILKNILNSDINNPTKHCLTHCFPISFTSPPFQEVPIHY